MGYIAPINHYQYRDYHERTVKSEPSPYTLERVFKATLDSKLEEKHGQPREQDRLDYQDARKRLLYAPPSIHVTHTLSESQTRAKEEIYSDLTGKGKNFSETV
ncbi:hypothetical protein LCM20_03020 [Halobacillus litoralis]|uniref:hypothetical protein n=1 Tax=Halobacillus litoralis TaxID=45668 RepID=UPI001CD1D86D|nr:hypothetical protein [Halobacillus litoralis]MCA0969562.1 hypothetical protein [Halobacillus litoralis]